MNLSLRRFCLCDASEASSFQLKVVLYLSKISSFRDPATLKRFLMHFGYQSAIRIYDSNFYNRCKSLKIMFFNILSILSFFLFLTNTPYLNIQNPFYADLFDMNIKIELSPDTKLNGFIQIR